MRLGDPVRLTGSREPGRLVVWEQEVGWRFGRPVRRVFAVVQLDSDGRRVVVARDQIEAIGETYE